MKPEIGYEQYVFIQYAKWLMGRIFPSGIIIKILLLSSSLATTINKGKLKDKLAPVFPYSFGSLSQQCRMSEDACKVAQDQSAIPFLAQTA